MPALPVMPPDENSNLTKSAASELLGAIGVIAISRPWNKWGRQAAPVIADSLTALDLCASLCRFTL